MIASPQVGVRSIAVSVSVCLSTSIKRSLSLHAVINNEMILFAAYTAAKTPMLFNGLYNCRKLPSSCAGLNPHLTHGSFGPPESDPPNGILIGSAVFAWHIRHMRMGLKL